MEMLQDLPIKKYLDKKQPSDNSNTTTQDILELTKIPIKENFVKEMDDGKGRIEKIVGKDPLVSKLINESRPIVDKLKKHFNRQRPKVLAKKMGVKMKEIELKTMKTQTYPSGHSIKAY